ncbi:MAG: class I SAM-dependent rRNA methyltransferase [Verrucomicrobiota bacterium]
MNTTPPKSQPRLRLRVSSAAERALRSRHPWLFADSIRDQNREGSPGEIAVVYDHGNQFLAAGLYDPDSPLRVRVLQVGKPAVINADWFRGRLLTATQVRSNLFGPETTGWRWINGESDGWPGLVLDRYGSTLVLKLYTLGWLPWLETLLPLILEELQPERLVLRLSRNIQEPARRLFARTDGGILHGPPLDSAVLFQENGLTFEAQVLQGQKTGFFLDQRENRRKVGDLARGRAVLNAFSFSGGFSLYAARGGAKRAVDLDISAHALAAANRNFAHNQSDASVAACHHETAQGDSFEWLEGGSGGEFGLVILDPPSLAKREAERAGALQAYQRLVQLAIRRLAPGGDLLACSCSAHVGSDEFFSAVQSAARPARRPFEVIACTAHAPDHPATIPEAQYLKAIHLRFAQPPDSIRR